MKNSKRHSTAVRQGGLHGSVPPPLQTLIELVGDQRILIENHHGMAAYSKQMISVKTSYGMVGITGRGLRIQQMTKNRIVIGGYIEEIYLSKGGTP